MTKKKRTLLTPKDLVKQTQYLNERFFNSRLIGLRVEFGKTPSHADGLYNSDLHLITLAVELQSFPNLCLIVLVHEMAHAYLEVQGYLGDPRDGGHGMRFQAELDRLYHAGVYDGLL